MLRRCTNAVDSFTATGVARRHIRARGQLYPIHSFTGGYSDAFDSVAAAAPPSTSAPVASSLGEFKTMVTNPGPMRVVYSDDYLDWYYRAYTEKTSFDRAKAVARQKGFDGRDVAQEVPSQFSNSTTVTMNVKPLHSRGRSEGERLMARSQRRIEMAATQQGFYDVLERAPQFPQVHLDRALDEHIRPMFDMLILRYEFAAADVWRRALIARAMLLANRASYPESFSYIFDALENCIFSKPSGLTAPAASADATGAGGAAEELNLDAATQRYPTHALASYYEYLVRKYHISNSAEAHVLLRCHLEPNADALLLCDPPPKEDEPGKSGGGAEAKAALQLPLPPLDALFDEAGNLPLARALLFAELNCAAATDVARKFPRAMAHVTRPSAAQTRDAFAQTSPTMRVRALRGDVIVPVLTMQSSTLEVRAREALGMANGSDSADAAWAGNAAGMLQATQDGDSTVGAPAFNHRTVRAELRDAASRRLVAGLKQYEAARELARRAPITDAEESTRFGTTLAAAARSSLMPLRKAAPTRPTVPRFAALVAADRHVRSVTAVLGDGTPAAAAPGTLALGASPAASESADVVLARRVRTAVLTHARQLYRLAMEYHVQERRAVEAQAAKVTAALLDGAVNEALEFIRAQRRPVTSGFSASVGGATEIDAVLQAPYIPFAARALDEAGLPTTARFDDWSRWMRPPPSTVSHQFVPSPGARE